MSTRTALNKNLIMRYISSRHQTQSAIPMTSPMTNSDVTQAVHFRHECDVQVSVFSDVFARVESGYNHFQTVIHDPRARAAAVSEVDKEVDAAWRHLRSLHNALAPISLLPSKILARVFYFLSLEESPISGKHNLGWIRTTHVCQLWRQVALGDSSLWARISGVPTNLELISEMLARARSAPLDIDIDLCRSRNPEVLLMFSPHLSHTRKLRLHGLSKLHSDRIRDLCSQEAQAMEHFELETSVTSPITFWKLGGTTLFKGRAPKLRTLILSQVLIPWSLIPRGQLTHLAVRLLNEASIADVPSHRGLNQLIDFLVLINYPGLEVLVLEFCLPSQLSQFPHGQTIHLPRLSRLCLRGPISRITILLKMFKIPSSTKLHLHCVSENNLAHNGHHLLHVISAHFQNHSPAEFKRLSVTFNYMCRFLDVTASTSLPTTITQSQDLESGIMNGEAEFVLCFDGLPEHGHWTYLIERVCKMLPISNLELLSISSPDIADSVNWVELFDRCPKVATLQAIGRGASGLMRAITTLDSNTRPSGKGKKKGRDDRDSTSAQPAKSVVSQAPIFPKLTFLSLKRFYFAENKHSSGILFDAFQNGLRQRKEAYRAPLEILSLDNCAISANRAKALQKLVKTLLWDHSYEEGFLDRFDNYEEPKSGLGFFFDGSTYGE